jgi:hypothetical protein
MLGWVDEDHAVGGCLRHQAIFQVDGHGILRRRRRTDA